MNEYLFYAYGHSGTQSYAEEMLKRHGFGFSQVPDNSVTHLLLPAPSFLPDGTVKGGLPLSDVMSNLSSNVTVIGGNLRHPQLYRYDTIDLLQDDTYLAQNASITANCALLVAMQNSKTVLPGQSVLVVGWGRIGKCLASLLKSIGCDVTVAARKEADRAMLSVLGYTAVNTTVKATEKYSVIFNTVPEMVLPDCSGDALKLELASRPGMSGKNIIPANGLPGKYAPQSAGYLIADTVRRILRKQEEVL